MFKNYGVLGYLMKVLVRISSLFSIGLPHATRINDDGGAVVGLVCSPAMHRERLSFLRFYGLEDWDVSFMKKYGFSPDTAQGVSEAFKHKIIERTAPSGRITPEGLTDIDSEKSSVTTAPISASDSMDSLDISDSDEDDY